MPPMDKLLTLFSEEEIIKYGVPEEINDPFRYFPHPLTMRASAIVREEISLLPEVVRESLEEGKMLGVALVRDALGRIGFLRGFSGLVGGRASVEGFVPPIFDFTNPEDFFKRGEAELNGLNAEIRDLEESSEYRSTVEAVEAARGRKMSEVAMFKEKMADAKRLRASRRDEVPTEELDNESRYLKGELRRLKVRLQADVEDAESRLFRLNGLVSTLKERRKLLSEELQMRLFKAYRVHNAIGDVSDVWEIFSSRGAVPPGGTGDCAGPKLVEYCWRNGLQPLAIGEFWFGAPLVGSGRYRGLFYPSCTAKCAPLLEFMLGRRPLCNVNGICPPLEVLFRDRWLTAVCKPSGFPSVPGLLDGIECVQDALSRQLGIPVFAVHRLDMDTSGLLLFAFDVETQSKMMEQFATGLVRKIYKGVLSPSDELCSLADSLSDSGEILLALSPDYADRPRQKAGSGKEAVTRYRVLDHYDDGRVLMEFQPLTGRTHQIRVHCANPAGLGRPLLGDALYGGAEASRLYLHAASIAFTHPVTGKQIDISCPPDWK